jgi:Fe-S-cluster-containing hydrogenase component 2
MDFVQLVRIKREDFAAMLRKFPEVEREITEVARARRQADAQALNRVQTLSVGDFVDQDLMQGQDLLLLDLDKCTRCDECVKACVATHADHVPRLIRDGLRFDHYLVPTSCRACMDPLCMTRCPVGSIRRKGTLDIVIEDWCIGCCNCAQDCPYGNINVVNLPERNARKAQPERPIAVVCDLCVEYDEPNCVRGCPHDAAIRVDARRFFARDLAGVQLAVPAGATAPPPTELAPAYVPTEQDQNMETQIYSNAAELLSMLSHLRIKEGPRAGAILQLRFPATTFGRAPENDWQFRDDDQMSRAHAIIEWQDQHYVLRDLNSTNGTTVNGETPVGEIELRDGDVIRMGELEAEFKSGTMS